jgi:hypothetical protein
MFGLDPDFPEENRNIVDLASTRPRRLIIQLACGFARPV